MGEEKRDETAAGRDLETVSCTEFLQLVSRIKAISQDEDPATLDYHIFECIQHEMEGTTTREIEGYYRNAALHGAAVPKEVYDKALTVEKMMLEMPNLAIGRIAPKPTETHQPYKPEERRPRRKNQVPLPQLRKSGVHYFAFKALISRLEEEGKVKISDLAERISKKCRSHRKSAEAFIRHGRYGTHHMYAALVSFVLARDGRNKEVSHDDAKMLATPVPYSPEIKYETGQIITMPDGIGVVVKDLGRIIEIEMHDKNRVKRVQGMIPLDPSYSRIAVDSYGNPRS